MNVLFLEKAYLRRAGTMKDLKEIFSLEVTPGLKQNAPCIILGAQTPDTSKDRDVYKDRCNDLAGIDIDVKETDLELNQEALLNQAFKLGFIAGQQSNSKRGLHLLMNIPGRGEAFNRALKMYGHDEAKKIYNELYIEFINQVTPFLVEGQTEEIKNYWLKPGKSLNQGYKYSLCDVTAKALNKVFYLTPHPWVINEGVNL